MAGKIKVPSELVPSQSNKIMLRSKYIYDDVKGHTQEEINAALEEQIESKVIEAGGVNWDTVPTANSNNAVKSKDIKAALEKVTGYFVLDNDVLESTVVKTVTVADFPALAIGGSIKIKMLTKNTAANPTLRIGPVNATAYPLYYNEERASASNTWEANEIISVFFDGTNYRASNSQGGSNKKIDAYLLGNLRTLAVGQAYEENEAVKTTNKQLLRVTKDVTKMNLTDTVAVGDLKVFGGNTYQAQEAIGLYDGTETEGLYAIGRPAGANIAVTVDNETIAALEESVLITVSIAGINLTVSVNSESTNLTIAADIAEAFGTQSEWALTDNLDGTLTLKSKVGKAAAPTVTSNTGDTGVTIGIVSDSDYAGSLSISQYLNGEWEDIVREDWVLDTDMWSLLSEEDLLQYTIQNDVQTDIDVATNWYNKNVFDINNTTVGTNNVTYITPLKLEDGGRWTIKAADMDHNRIGHFIIPVLSVGKTYKVTFSYISTLTVNAEVQLCKHSSTSGSNVTVTTVSTHGKISPNTSGDYSFVFTYTATTTRYLGVLFKQPVKNQKIEIHNLTICEIRNVKDEVQKLIDNNIVQNSSANSDLDIVDPQDNVLARFYKGHIKTKNFDSSEWINLTSKFKDKKFAIVGDSISTYNGWLPSSKSGYSGSAYATYYPHSGGDVQSAAQIWWYKLLVKLGITPSKWNNINVVSWSGSTVCGDSTSTTNAKPACSDKRIADIGLGGFVPDIIICFISCNDWGLDYALGNWQVSDAIPAEGNITKARAAYALMLHKIHTTYPKARVFCCTILDDIKRDRDTGWPSNNNNGVTTHQWNQNIKEIAEAFGCDIIDMHACGINYQNIASLVVDEGLHPNDEGHTMMAEKVFAELIAKY